MIKAEENGGGDEGCWEERISEERNPLAKCDLAEGGRNFVHVRSLHRIAPPCIALSHRLSVHRRVCMCIILQVQSAYRTVTLL